MRLSLNGLKRGLTDPRKMMLIAGVLAAMGLVAGYVEVHDEADRALALHEGPPPAQTLQSFAAAPDVAAYGEVVILAEADLTRAIEVTLRSANPHRRALVVPLYALTEAGAALAGHPGAAAPQPTLGGYILHPIAPGAEAPAADTLAAEIFGAVGGRVVVALNGAAPDPGAFGLLAEGAITGMGLTFDAAPVAIEPFAEGRAAAFAAQPTSQTHRALFLLAGLVMVVSVAVSLRDHRAREGMAMWALPEPGRAPQIDTAREPTRPAPPRHPQFAPIPSQQSLHARASERSAGRFSALAGAAQRAVKNRPKRPEDEAL